MKKLRTLAREHVQHSSSYEGMVDYLEVVVPGETLGSGIDDMAIGLFIYTTEMESGEDGELFREVRAVLCARDKHGESFPYDASIRSAFVDKE